MGSTTRWRGVYGGEYAPTGLRLFAWWKKNGERRLQKPGSGSAGIRSFPTASALSAFIDAYTNNLECVPSYKLTCLPRTRCLAPDRSPDRSPCSLGRGIGLASRPMRQKPTWAQSTRARARIGIDPWPPRAAAVRASQGLFPGRRSPLFFSFLSFYLYLFLLNK
jgi:hypothetical protein